MLVRRNSWLPTLVTIFIILSIFFTYDNNGTMTLLEENAVLIGNEAYYVQYSAPISQFSIYKNIADEMVASLVINLPTTNSTTKLNNSNSNPYQSHELAKVGEV
jgi:hypothetical protein